LIKLDIQNTEQIFKLFDNAKKYRESNFDDMWKSCIEKDEADSSSVFVVNDGSNAVYKDLPVGVFIEIPHSKLSNRRKAASLVGFDMVPYISTDIVDVPDYVEARERILRWGFRQARVSSVAGMCIKDLVAISNGVAQVTWKSKGGVSYPMATYKNPFNVYFDPLSRHIDPNIDCRYIFECVEVSEEEAELRWPDHSFSKSMSDKNYETSDKPPVYKIIRCEWEDENGQIMSGILNGDNKTWVEEPTPNSTGLYSYCRMSLAPKRDHAYPEPDTVLEQTLSDVANLLLTIAVDHQLRFSSPPILYDVRDTDLKKALGSANAFKPGQKIPYNSAYGRPMFLEVPPNTPVLQMAQILEEKAEGIASTPDASRGVAPGSVKSGRGVIALQQAASAPMAIYLEGVMSFGEQVGAVVSKLCQKNLVDYRVLVSKGQDGKESTPINLPTGTTEFEQYRQNQSIPTSVSARVPMIGESGERQGMMSMSQDDAVEYALSKGLTENDIQLVINDMALGEMEVGVQIFAKRTWEQRAIDAQNLHAIGAAGPKYVLRESRVENPEDVIREVDERNAQMKAGELMLNNPLLMELATNPEAQIALQMMLEKSVAKTQQNPPS